MDDFFGLNPESKRPVMTSDRLKDQILRIIISGNHTFASVEDEEFRDLLREAFPDCNIPSRWTLVEYLSSKAKLVKIDLQKELAANNSKISLALDVWTTRSNLAFLGTFLGLSLSTNRM